MVLHGGKLSYLLEAVRRCRGIFPLILLTPGCTLQRRIEVQFQLR